MKCIFVSDLHGHIDRYRKLFEAIKNDPPDALLMGGDLLPSGAFNLTLAKTAYGKFIEDFLLSEFVLLKDELGKDYPEVFIIMGNDDGRFEENRIIEASESGVWKYAHNRKHQLGEYDVYGYSYVPPSPFLLKDWERYDVSRYVDPGCISPEEGKRSIPISNYELKYSTIANDVKQLMAENNLKKSIFLFHAPPYQTNLDRVGMDGVMIDHAPVDVHVGSVAIRKFIEGSQPLLTLHGHIHESARITGSWRDRIGETLMLSAAHDGPELCLVKFDLEKIEEATRELI